MGSKRGSNLGHPLQISFWWAPKINQSKESIIVKPANKQSDWFMPRAHFSSSKLKIESKAHWNENLKRLKLGNTAGRQHRFSDYFIPHMAWYLWVHEKYPRDFFFGLKQGFQSGFFRFGQKFSNLTKFLCTPKNHYFEHFGGRQRLAGL